MDVFSAPADIDGRVRSEAQRLSDNFYSRANETAQSTISSSLATLQRYRVDRYGEQPDLVLLFPPSHRTETDVCPGSPSLDVADVIDLDDDVIGLDGDFIDLDDEEDNEAALVVALTGAPVEARLFEARQKMIAFMFPDSATRNQVTMGPWFPVPEYRGWAHVQKEFYAGDEFPPVPHMPYLGDDESERKTSEQVYNRMTAATGNKAADPEASDGEMDDHNDFFVFPANTAALIRYWSLKESREREMRRVVTLGISCLFSLDSVAVVDALAAFFGIRKDSPRDSRAHVQKIFELAKERVAAFSAKQIEGADRKKDHARLAEAWERDAGHPESTSKEWFEDNETAAMRYFCFTCHKFCCRQHSGTGVEPIQPIKDSYVEMRNAALKDHTFPPMLVRGPIRRKDKSAKPSPALEPCSKNCFLTPLSGLQGNAARERPDDLRWTAEQWQLLRLGLLMFQYDPCNIALAVGGKTCSETYIHLETEEMREECFGILKEGTTQKWPMEYNRGRPVSSLSQREEGEKKDKDLEGKAGKKNMKHAGSSAGSRRRTSMKTLANSAKSKEDKSSSEGDRSDHKKDFVPCAHTGHCSKSTDCSCFVNNLTCEATCGCNSSRWTSRGLENSGTKKCSRRFIGCDCAMTSGCNSDTCACWIAGRSCDPDFCNSCSASILPCEINASERGCLNIGVVVKNQKVAKVGRSRTHGFGLFCGEAFNANDVIGVYGGRILDTEIAETEGYVYKVADHTFLYDLTENIVIDGGLLGMKTKFANHAFDADYACNATGRCVMFRGDPHIVLCATRNIKVGEEIKFDYNFNNDIPVWAIKPKDGSQ